MDTGHLTQLIWKSSTSIGLGMAAGMHGNLNAYYCTAQYSPRGNIVGNNNQYFRVNVLPPTSNYLSSSSQSLHVTWNNIMNFFIILHPSLLFLFVR